MDLANQLKIRNQKDYKYRPTEISSAAASVNAYLVADMHLILAARELWVLLYQTLQPDTVELGYAVEAVAGTDVVGMVFILLGSTLALLQPYNLAHLEVVAVFPLVPFCYLPTRDSYLLADGLEACRRDGP